MMIYAAAIDLASFHRSQGRPIVFKTGCFDIFHVGHLQALKFSSFFGALFVGIGSDETVRALKGNDRPVFREQDRLEVVASLKCVDCAFILREPLIGRIDHAQALWELRPDFWILPPTDKALKEKTKLANELGIQIRFKDELAGCSSTALLEHMR